MNGVGRIDSKTQFYSLFPSLYSLNALTTNLQFTLPLDPSNSGHMFTVPNYMDQLNNYQGLQKKYKINQFILLYLRLNEANAMKEMTNSFSNSQAR